MTEVTFVLMVKNGEKTLKPVLTALRKWPRVIVVDTGSEDKTLEIAQSFSNVVLQQIPFEGFGKTRNAATKFAKTDWVFHLDADEIPSNDLLETLCSKTLEAGTLYEIFRENYFWKKAMRGCSGWYPDYVLRLFNKNECEFSQLSVHEKLIVKNKKIEKIQGKLIHTPYQDLKQMLAKMNHYSELFATSSKKQVSIATPFFHAIYAFIKSYFFKRGLFQGIRGLILSKYIADTTFYKYLKIYEKRHR